MNFALYQSQTLGLATVLGLDDSIKMPMVLLSGVLLIIVYLFMSLRKRRRQSVQYDTPHEQLERLKQKSGMRGDLEQLMVEIEQLAKRLGAQLDAKTIELEKMLREAEQTMAKLQQMHQGGLGADAADAPGSRGFTSAAIPPESPDQPASGDVPANGADQTLRQSVYELADQGLDPVAIARRLDEQVGKVELILTLRQV